MSGRRPQRQRGTGANPSCPTKRSKLIVDGLADTLRPGARACVVAPHRGHPGTNESTRWFGGRGRTPLRPGRPGIRSRGGTFTGLHRFSWSFRLLRRGFLGIAATVGATAASAHDKKWTHTPPRRIRCVSRHQCGQYVTDITLPARWARAGGCSSVELARRLAGRASPGRCPASGRPRKSTKRRRTGRRIVEVCRGSKDQRRLGVGTSSGPRNGCCPAANLGVQSSNTCQREGARLVSAWGFGLGTWTVGLTVRDRRANRDKEARIITRRLCRVAGRIIAGQNLEWIPVRRSRAGRSLRSYYCLKC